jgi:hypothetical protein
LPLVAFGFLLALISTVCIYFFPESPVYLISKGQYSEAKKSFEYIAKKNGREFEFSEEYFT